MSSTANLALDLDDPQHRRALRALLDDLDATQPKPAPKPAGAPSDPEPVDDLVRAKMRRALREKGIK